jgi:hypothetical protein
MSEQGKQERKKTGDQERRKGIRKGKQEFVSVRRHHKIKLTMIAKV